ncbi:MAG: TRAP transporter substrate-binding protein DctP [Hyphomicrobiales bacterium]|nr:TRAP transporter substrate-binding protein DctP [Hyphomicrobiales bacterium]
MPLFRVLICAVIVAVPLLPAISAAEPLTLKLAFFTSDRTHLYRANVKPFVDAINLDGKGRVHIDVYLSNRLGKSIVEQTKLLDEGAADIVYAVPPYEPDVFPDSKIILMPGMFEDAREATLVYSRLVAEEMVRDFKNYFVIGVFVTQPQSIHARDRIDSIDDLKGKSIRANNSAESEVLKKFGAKPVFIPVNKTLDGITSGKVDGAYVPPIALIEFGIGRVAPNHYLLKTSSIPLVLIMKKDKFDSLPKHIQGLIQARSGGWLEDIAIRTDLSATALVMKQIMNNDRRKVVTPSSADMAKASSVFTQIINDFKASDPHHARMFEAAEVMLSEIRDVR